MGSGRVDASENELARRKRAFCVAGARRLATEGADGNHVSVAAVLAGLKLSPMRGATYGEPRGKQAFRS